jgi:NDP-sugar pyrophosphorylase family protein
MIKQALILSGGLGSRLGSITKDTPKPMLLVGEYPFIDYLIWNLKRHGIDKILISIGYKADKVTNYINSLTHYKGDITCIVEHELLDTGGAIKFASSELDSEFLVINGDSLFNIDYESLEALLIKFPEAMVAMALRDVNDNSSRYGKVLMEDEKVIRFIEKDGKKGYKTTNGGIYLMRREVLDLMPDGKFSLEYDLFPKLAYEELIVGKKWNEYFIDIGMPSDFKRAQIELPRWKKTYHKN